MWVFSTGGSLSYGLQSYEQVLALVQKYRQDEWGVPPTKVASLGNMAGIFFGGEYPITSVSFFVQNCGPLIILSHLIVQPEKLPGSSLRLGATISHYFQHRAWHIIGTQ